MSATWVDLYPGRPDERRIGSLTFLGGVALHSDDGAFGGFSSLSVRGDRFVLLSDGGNIVRFRMDARFAIGDVAFDNLPAGPGRGWSKRSRDSESMTLDPAGRAWIGFENFNEIWRYAPGLRLPAVGAAPPAMAKWDSNGGPESLVRLRDGRMLTIAETQQLPGSEARVALMFASDPVAMPRRGVRFGYLPPAGFDPSDATQLPDGRIMVLNRRLAPPLAWSAALTLIDPAGIRPGAIVRGREIARLAPPLTVDNFEGLAATREGGATILWIVSDDNLFPLERTLLLKFRLEP